MKQAQEWYEDQSNSSDLLVYYTGEYKKRNDILFSILQNFIPENAEILDLAAGSSYLAERLLTIDSIKSYTWNDFNKNIAEIARSRISNTKFKIEIFFM